LDGSHSRGDAVFSGVVTTPKCDGEFELLFYLVPGGSAQRLCRRREEKFAIEFRSAGFDADEQVPKYPEGCLQVPYNQQLEQCFSGALR
jgi:hypothetical protein